MSQFLRAPIRRGGPAARDRRVNDVLALVAKHGEILLFLYVFADQLGVPIPASPVLIAAGGLAAAGRLSLPGAIGLGVVATLGADLIWYALGRVRGASVLALLCRVSLEPDSCVRRTQDVFLRHGVRFLLFAKFVPGLGTVGPPRWHRGRRGTPILTVYRAPGPSSGSVPGWSWATQPDRPWSGWSPRPVSLARPWR